MAFQQGGTVQEKIHHWGVSSWWIKQGQILMSCLAYYFPGLSLLIFVTEQSKWYTKSCTVLQGKSVFCLLCILRYFNHCTSSLISISCALKFQQFLAGLEIFLNISLLFLGADIVHSLSSYSDSNTICVISWSFCFPYKNNFILGNHPGSFHLFYVFPLIVNIFSFKEDETSDSSYEVSFPWVRMIKYLNLPPPPPQIYFKYKSMRGGGDVRCHGFMSFLNLV